MSGIKEILQDEIAVAATIGMAVVMGAFSKDARDAWVETVVGEVRFDGKGHPLVNASVYTLPAREREHALMAIADARRQFHFRGGDNI